MDNLRFQVVSEAFRKKPLEVKAPGGRPSGYFAKYVFNREKMYKYLPKDVYSKLTDVIDNGARLDRSVADAVAEGMKRWAMEMGVTHYTHWFQPLTEGTAEKHDSFIEHDFKGGVVEQRRHTQHVRGTRLLGLGPHFARLHHRRHALHPHDLHIIHGRVARLQGPAAARAQGGQRRGHRRMPLLLPRGEEGAEQPRLGAGVLPR